MKGLRTARVVVIDDDPNEAMPVITAMGRLGIGCIHVRGDRVEELPAEPFVGIRLAFVDMLLGSSGDARQIGAQAANVLAHAVRLGPAPLLLLLWTKHAEYVDEFKRALFEADPTCRSSLFFAAMEKPLRAEDISIESILAQAERIVRDQFPVVAIWQWEQLSHDAATDTTSAIADVVAKRARISTNDSEEQARRKWLDAFSDVFRWLIQAVAGKSGTDTTAWGDLISALVQIHRDRLENQLLVGEGAEIARVLRAVGDRPSPEERCALNTMLLTAPVRLGDSAFRPGNCYIPHPDDRTRCLHVQCAVDSNMLAREILQFERDADCRQLTDDLNRLRTQCGDNAAEIAVKEEALRLQIATVTSGCIPVLLEMTATCDFAQRKCRIARFLGGFLVPEADEKKLVRQGDSNRVLSAVQVSVGGQTGAYCLVVSCRFPYTIPSDSVVVPPVFRLRGPVLQDFQNWSASHCARPGYVRVEPR